MTERSESHSSQERVASQTALATTTMRALAAHDERPELRGPDYLAEIFLDQKRKQAIQDAVARAWILQEKTAPGVYEFMIARTLFFDEIVEQALAQNIPQIVFLGAGYDSRPYRFAARIKDTRIFELDSLPTQQHKIKALSQAGVPIPDQVVYIAVDFETTDLRPALDKAGFDTELRTLFIWEGVTYYLSAPAVDGVLSFVQENSPPGSLICFDYAHLSPQALDEEGVMQLRQHMRSAHAAEPVKFGIRAGELESFLAQRGFILGDHVTPEDMEARYLTFQDGTSAGKPSPLMYLAQALVADHAGFEN
jgi:methyltransferase (TIGR00027 family)